MERVILHLDMDAFFAAVEQRDRPELRGKPVIVGAPGPRGVVSTCSYEARAFGVRSAMPSVTAQRLCPQGIWVRPNFPAYEAASHTIFERVARRVPIVEQVSIDEAYGDMTGAVRDLAAAADVTRALKEEIRAATSLTASAGLSYCRFLAKIASDLRKPDGLVVVAQEDVATLIWPLPARRIPGVGPKLEGRLLELGIRTIGDLARCNAQRLENRLGASTAHYLLERARGWDETPIEPHGERKQVSEERTYLPDLADPAEIDREMFARCEGIAAELRRREIRARTVTLKVRDARFNTVTRSHTVDDPVDLATEIFEVARTLYRERTTIRNIRLLGVGVKDFVHARDVPPTLFPDERRERAHAAARAADLLREKYGADAVRPARLVKRAPKKTDDDP